MPLPAPLGKLSRLRAQSMIFDDTEEVIRAIEKLDCAQIIYAGVRSKSYETLRNILLERGVIEPVPVLVG
jgi:hypothetical protein